MKMKDLVFQKLEDPNTPVDFKCNNCGKSGGHGFFAVDVKIAIDATFMIVACSESCVKGLKNHKHADDYLKERISTMRTIHRRNAIKKQKTKPGNRGKTESTNRMKKLFLASFEFATGTEAYQGSRLVVVTEEDVNEIRKKSEVDITDEQCEQSAAVDKVLNWFPKNYPESRLISAIAHAAIE